MEHKQISCGAVHDRLPTLSAKYPWLIAQNLEAEEDDTKDQIFYTMNDPLTHYRCQIPELLGRRIRGYFHGWVILSNHPQNAMWSLWNPETSKVIRLPPLTLKDGDLESINQCCLSSPPDDPTSVLMLTRAKTSTIVFCQVDSKRKKLRWKEMMYAKKLRSIVGIDGFLHCLTCCNGKVYALVNDNLYVVQVDIAVKGTEIVISLVPFALLPFTYCTDCSAMKHFLKGYCADLFYIKVGFVRETNRRVGVVFLFKLDWESLIWEEMEDLKEAIFVVDIDHDCSVFYRDEIASELGGYVHILGDMGKVIYSYDVKDKIISLFSSGCLVQAEATHVSLWECRLQGDHQEIECETSFEPQDNKEDEIIVSLVRDDKVNMSGKTRNEENYKPSLLSIPFDVLKTIVKFCVGVEYLNFRATCKYCQLAAPMIQWSSETSLRRLHTYSLISPWLIELDKYQGVITFTDPMFGEKYFMTTPQELIGDMQILCSKYGWLLLFKFNQPLGLFFFNPFTNNIREVPETYFLFDSACFSAPPTSPNCAVVGLSASQSHVFIYFINRESAWRRSRIDISGTTPHCFPFSTFCGQDIYALNEGSLNVFRVIDGHPFWNGVVAEAPRGRGCSSVQYFLVNCDRRLLLVVMDEFGGFVEVLKLNGSTKEWEKMDSLGRHMIYICGTMCLCMEAKTPEMENKIYFPRLHSKSGKMIFYSLETCSYHTFNGRNIQQGLEDFFGTKYHVYPHAWIEPSWS